MDRIYTPQQLAERWSCCPNSVRKAIRENELKGFRIGRLMRVTEAAVEEYEKRQ